jgi:hypothetical protein
MSATALAVCPFCQHQAAAPALLKGARTQCPNCSNFYIFEPVEPTAEMSSGTAADPAPLVPRVARRRVMQIQCPNCACELHLTRTRYVRLRKRDLAKLKRKLRKRAEAAAALAAPAGAPPETTSTEVAAATVPETPLEPAPAPEPFAALAAPSAASATPRRKQRAAAEQESGSSLEWLVPCVLVLISSAIFCTPFSFSAPLVLPLAAVGCVSGAALLVAAIRRRDFLYRAGATAGYGAMALLLIGLAPGLFGSKYHSYRHDASDTDLVQVIPKSGQPATDIPNDADWVDASKYLLEQHGVVIEIVNVSLGKVETKTPGGSMKMSSEPYLVIWLRRRHASDVEEFGANPHGRKEAQDVELKMTLTDDQGRECPRQQVDLGWNSAGMLRSSNVFPTAMTDDVLAFAPPQADFQSLRLEISMPQFGGKPLRFLIPKSMFGRPMR